MTTDTSIDITIRPFDESDADYAALAAVRNAIFPDYATTTQELRRWDERRHPEHLSRRLVAEAGGQVVGVANYGHLSWNYHPHKFELGVHVHPGHQRRGVGARLYERAMGELAAHDPIVVRHFLREDYDDGVRFAKQRGFVEERRAWESRLDLSRFDPARFAGAVERVEAQGIVLRTAGELAAGDPDFWQKLYDLDTTLGHDVPSPDPFTPTPFERWLPWFTESPTFLPDGFFIAVDNGHYVGLSALWRRETSPDLDTGLTGVRREYRRRGIALALKLRAIDYAMRAGAPVIRTDNAETNRPMLSINEALGFEKLPAWLTLRKNIRGE